MTEPDGAGQPALTTAQDRGEEIEMFELVELDPETGEEDQVLSPKPGTFAQMERDRERFFDIWREDWDEHGEPWSPTLIRPASK